MTFKEIQEDVVRRYRIDLCDGTKCKNDWSRTHAHPKQRRVCKWKQANSMKSTFTLLHEVGHIEANDGKMRRAESEFHATIWALERAREYGMEIPDTEIDRYQRYIYRERDRGIRRGGTGYGNLDLMEEMDKRHPSTWAVLHDHCGKGILDTRRYHTRCDAEKRKDDLERGWFSLGGESAWFVVRKTKDGWLIA